MSTDTDSDAIFEKYLDDKTFSQRLKEPKTWIFLFIAAVGIAILIWAYKAIFLDKMSPEELKNSIQVLDIDTQWVEKGRGPEGVKIVPSITFKVKNIGKRPLSYVTFEGIFTFDETGQTHSDGLNQVFYEPLPPGETSDTIFVKSSFGYSASTKEAFLENKENWKVMDVNVFAKTKGSGPVMIIEKHPIKQVIEGLKGKEISSEETKRLHENAEKLKKALTIVEQSSKWLDRKRTKKEVVIVPTIKIKIGNDSQEPIKNIAIKGSFLFADTGEWLSDGITQALQKPLEPGGISDEILIKAENGYKATSKKAIVDNWDSWRSVKVNIYVKTINSAYTLLGTYPVSRDVEGIKKEYRHVMK